MSEKINDSATPAKKFKSPNAYVVISAIIVFVAALTWIIPGGEYALDEAGRAIAGTYSASGANPQGIWDVLLAPIVGMVGNDHVSAAITISLNIMLFGAFLEMMDASGAINIALKGVAIRNKDNYHTLIIILVTIMGIFGTVQGAYEEGFVYLLMFLPIIIGMGLDTVVATMIVVLGTQAGCIASIVNPFSTGIASGIAQISPGEGMGFRVIIFVIVIALVSAYIIRYADKVKANPNESWQFFRKEKDVEEFSGTGSEKAEKLSKEQGWVLKVFIATFVIMILSLVPWTSLNPNWTFFDDLVAWVTAIPFLGALIGKDIVPLGYWYFNEINVLLIVATFTAGAIMHYDADKSINIFIKGAAGLVSTAFIVPLARGIQVIMDSGSITPTILHAGETSLAALPPFVFVIVCLIFYLLMASFIPSSTGLAAATMSIMAPLALFAGIDQALMIDIYNMALGIAKMIMPTSIIVMTCISAAHISYGTWVRKNTPFMGVLFVVCGLILMVGVII